jgi:signal transduction histidine kinase
MDLINFFVFVAFLINIILSFTLQYNSKKSKSNLYFAFVGYAISGWCISMFMYRNVNADYVVFWAKMLYLFASFIPTMFFLFALSFPNKSFKLRTIFLVLLFNFIFGIAIFYKNWVIKGVDIPNDTERIIHFGWLYFCFYIFYTPIAFCLPFLILFLKLRKYKSLVRFQLIYIIFGSTVTSSIGMFSNLVLPTFAYFQLNWMGQVSTIIWITVVSYAILRYKLFDIRIVLGGITYYFLFGAIFYISFYLIISLHFLLFGGIFTIGGYIMGAVIAVMYVWFSNFINRYIQKKIDSTLINPGFSPTEVLNEFNTEISKLLDSIEISNTIISTIKKSIRPVNVDILVVKGDQENTLIQNIFNQANIEKLLMAINVWQNTTKEPIILDLIEFDILGSFVNMKNWLDEITAEMKKNNIKVLIPIVGGKEVNGILLLGKKDSDLPYNTIELNFLKSICSSSGLALNRAFLYHEVEDLNENLQMRIDDATKELRVKVDALEEARRKERDMLDILGHELRTPLTIVRNAIQVLTGNQSQGKLSEVDLIKYLSMASNNTDRELELLESMLTSTKIDNDNLNLIFEKIALDDILTNTLNAFSDKSATKGLKLINNVPTGISVYADHIRIQQVIDNLVDNAIKYTNKGEIILNAKIENSDVIISVVDSGIGIPKEFIDKLGRKFYRINTYLDSSSRTGIDIVRPGGAGLGLYVVYGLIKAMNGKIDVISEIGKGSTFSFSIPKYVDQPVMQVGPKREKLYEKFERLKKERIEIEIPKSATIPLQSKDTKTGLPNLPNSK